MNKSEVAKLLAVVSAVDHRKVGEADVEAWHMILDRTRFADAQAAVIEYFKETKDWLAPSDILRIVRRMRSARVAVIDAPAPPRELADTPKREAAWLASFRHGLADGLDRAAAIQSANDAHNIADEPKAIGLSPESIRELIRAENEKRLAALNDERHKTEAKAEERRALMAEREQGKESA